MEEEKQQVNEKALSDSTNVFKELSPFALPNPFALESFSVEKWTYMMLFDTERWYPDLKDFTFETDFMELTIEEGKAIVHHYQQNCLGRKGVLTEEEEKLLEGLENRLQVRLDSFERSENETPEFFVRLSSRSPKDVGLGPEHPKILQYLEEELNKLGGLEKVTPNDALRAIQTAAGRILRVTTAREALWLIENSERTFSDLIHTMDFPSEWAMKIVIRRWKDGVDVGNEFRGFMCGGKLTALSQYNDSCYYPELLKLSDVIVNKIMEFWKELAPHVHHQAAIVDFVLVDNFSKVYCVELNPFGPVTGSSLFDWRFERNLLQGGKDIWNDLAECRERMTDIPEEELLYKEFFTGDPDRPVLRILKGPPAAANEAFLSTFPVLKALKRQKKKEEQEKRDEEEKEKEQEKKQKGNCILQ